ncbi:Glutathione S-transferase T1 [Sesamum angolense]|uniref:Glutathione S-transferase T1 n=1 Tax=Sesamum angolense TaxID=2727404 RepID=A0AAE2BL16_9LAMI|nr:Glutathione S-transferase T1 [Sesamum angolense]
MELKLYVDRISQPSRAILIFCKANGIEFEEVKIELAKKQHHSPEFAEVNPMKQVPAIVHGDFKLFERYPADVGKRAKIHSVLDWHHTNLRRGSAAEGENLMSASLATLESFWLEGDAPFLLGNSKPSIADLALVCEIMQLEFADEEDRERILGPHKRILKWIEDTKNATAPYFDEIHSIMVPIREKLKELKMHSANIIRVVKYEGMDISTEIPPTIPRLMKIMHL